MIDVWIIDYAKIRKFKRPVKSFTRTRLNTGTVL